MEPSSSTDVEEDQFLDEQSLSNIPANVLTVHNVLASGTLACNTRLDLDKCCTVLGNSYYSPAEFPALRVDVRGKRSAVFTVSLFESGRIQSTGGCRPIEAKKAMMKIGRRLRRTLNYNVTFQNFEIQNILAVYDAGIPVSLSHFATAFTGHIYYEPDRFPAARVRIPVLPSRPKQPAGKPSESTETADEEKRVSAKLRKLMVGDTSSASAVEVSRGVGSYMISADAKRPATGKQKLEKLGKQETVTANVFSTGKITFTGAKSIASLNYALAQLKPVIGAINGEQGCFGQPWNAPALNPDLQARVARLQQQEAYSYPPMLPSLAESSSNMPPSFASLPPYMPSAGQLSSGDTAQPRSNFLSSSRVHS